MELKNTGYKTTALKNNSADNYSFANVGRLLGDESDAKNAEFSNELVGTIKGKNFLKDTLALTGMEVSLNVLPADAGMPFYHVHNKNEELYIFIKGQGQFQVDEEIFDVKEGTMVRVSPNGVRTWRNNGTEDLFYIVIQARENSMAAGDISDGSAVAKEVEWPEECPVAVD